jgi:hypothetical protein
MATPTFPDVPPKGTVVSLQDVQRVCEAKGLPASTSIAPAETMFRGVRIGGGSWSLHYSWGFGRM